MHSKDTRAIQLFIIKLKLQCNLGPKVLLVYFLKATR